MSIRYASSWGPPNLIEALKAEGYPVPEECADVRLSIPVDGALELHLVQFLTSERLAQLGRALARMGEGGLEADRTECLRKEKEEREKIEKWLEGWL